MPAKKFDFKNVDGETLTGRLELPFGPPKAYAIFAHCFTCSKNVNAATVVSRELAKKGYGVLRFDFTGLGNSSGDFANTSFSSNMQDLMAAYKALEKTYQAPSLLVGHSLGGAAVLHACTQLPEVKAVATIGAPSEVAHVSHLFQDNLEEIHEQGEALVQLGGRPFKIKKQFVDDLHEHRLLEELSSVRKAFLFLHSPVDDTVSVEHAGKLYSAAHHPKSFISLDNADHLLSSRRDGDYAAEVISSWAGRYVHSEEETATPRSEEVLVQSRPGHSFTNDIWVRGHGLSADEPKAVKGDDLGPTPYELLLSALGACTSMTLRMYANQKQWPVDDIKVELSHAKIHAEDCVDCETKEGKVDQIQKKIFVSGNLDTRQVERLKEIAEKCPVHKTLLSEISMQGSIEKI